MELESQYMFGKQKQVFPQISVWKIVQGKVLCNLTHGLKQGDQSSSLPAQEDFPGHGACSTQE